MAAGVAGSMGAGAVVLGYYVAYWAAIRWRMRTAARGTSRWQGKARQQ